jgi:NAD-dependent dihydropyrimidine dehydrogenase PreA subunit
VARPAEPAPAAGGVRDLVVAIDAMRCTGCGACLAICPAGALRLDGEVAQVDPRACLGCGVCVPECPAQAIAQPGVEQRGN